MVFFLWAITLHSNQFRGLKTVRFTLQASLKFQASFCPPFAHLSPTYRPPKKQLEYHPKNASKVGLYRLNFESLE